MSKLKLGLIPQGEPCPFLSDCGLRIGRCPTKEQPKQVDYSCAAARLWDLSTARDPQSAT